MYPYRKSLASNAKINIGHKITSGQGGKRAMRRTAAPLHPSSNPGWLKRCARFFYLLNMTGP